MDAQPALVALAAPSNATMQPSSIGGPSPQRRDLPPLGALRAPSIPLGPNRLRPLAGEGGDAEPVTIHTSNNRLRPLDVPSGDLPIGRATRLDFSQEGVGQGASVARPLPSLQPPPRYGDDTGPPPLQPAIPFRPRVDDFGQQPRRERMDGTDGSYDPTQPRRDMLVQGERDMGNAEFRQPVDVINQQQQSSGRFRNNDLGRSGPDGERMEQDGYATSTSAQQQPGSNLLSPPSSAAPGQLSPANKTPRVPLTPSRAQFSPHAFGKDAPKSAQPPTPDQRRTGTANPPMKDMEELLNPPALQVYLAFFLRLGYSDLEKVLEFDDDKIDWMLDEVEAECEATAGIVMKGGHKNHILTRIKQERTKKGTMSAKAKSPLASEYNRQFQTSGNAVTVIAPPRATTNIVMLDGMKGLLRHWCCCFGLALLLIIISTIFIILYQKIGRAAIDNNTGSSGAGVNGSDVSSTAQGGWKFIYIVSILGFIFAGVAFLLSILSWMRNPNSRNCDCKHLLPDCKNCGFSTCKEGFKDCCTCPDCDCCTSCAGDCCPASCGLQAICVELKSCWTGATDTCKEECHFPDCPECNCAESCGCSTVCCKECFQECGCASEDCCDCKDCCKDCECPSCECNCCPDCEGDCNSCCSTLYKVCCCQCKIQVS